MGPEQRSAAAVRELLAAREEKSTTVRAGKAAMASLGGKTATATRQRIGTSAATAAADDPPQEPSFATDFDVSFLKL